VTGVQTCALPILGPLAAVEHLAEHVAEHLGEDVVDVVEALAAAAPERPLTVDAGMAVAVVRCALVGVRQHRIGLGQLLESGGRFLATAVAVRVVLHRQPAAGRYPPRTNDGPLDTRQPILRRRKRASTNT